MQPLATGDLKLTMGDDMNERHRKQHQNLLCSPQLVFPQKWAKCLSVKSFA